jgi:hypothetical protein
MAAMPLSRTIRATPRLAYLFLCVSRDDGAMLTTSISSRTSILDLEGFEALAIAVSPVWERAPDRIHLKARQRWGTGAGMVCYVEPGPAGIV